MGYDVRLNIATFLQHLHLKVAPVARDETSNFWEK